MTNPTYGQPIIEPDDIVERIDALIPRDATGTPLAWANRQVPFRTLFDARNEIQGLRSQLDATYVAARVRMLEEALADERAIRARLAEANDDLRARLRASETETERLRARVEALKETLGLLVDHQNGCPLPSYADEWNRAMAQAKDLLETAP